ncbi:bifunctional tRNA (5-methylaminomethyl-2-thiouridine)(34)-methyltransferase MnmD/FAD-dependent 5-carboxymethylaminomethyl-2-thiouridine(34) oxidoreductase MnmC [bacterium SCSIO 12696]|nr:bifunctional tRNA (5-methylaminomethyl-2-thiouridine)(34)-methyltransferase MnmD/FAD-dependent 5-carboxymethylaminomethyl-2-thiouridine(34) oxidoreductase MnmC [bacterium SCSIO 12696]
MTDSIQPAELEWDSDGQPTSRQYNDVYFSKASGIDETRHVFLHHNHLQQRWLALNPDQPHHFTIGETGFGTGLNFLAAVQLWLKTAPPNWRLVFVSAEKYPLSAADLATALALWPELNKLSTELQDHYPPPIPGVHTLSLFDDRVQLTLLFGEAADLLGQLRSSDHPVWQQRHNPIIDAWFLDGFAPSQNPDMWSEALFRAIADLSKAGTTLATFTAAGAVRRGLAAVGFEVEKVAGFGRKREMVRATIATQQPPEPNVEQLTPSPRNGPTSALWYLNTNRRAHRKHAAVIGGGIAGCSVARALAVRGWKVTLVERHSELASEASGNPQGVIYPKFSKQNSTLSRYGLHALLYASGFYQPFWQNGNYGARCGVLLLPETPKQADDFIAISKRFANAQRLVRPVSGGEIDNICGLPLNNDQGLFCPSLGWVVPPKICKALTEHPNIEVIQGEVTQLEQSVDTWQLLDATSNLVISSETVVVACSHQAATLQQCQHLPLKRIRGQISQVETPNSPLKTVVCGSAYIAPAHQGSLTLGATYHLNDNCPDVRLQDHRENFAKLASMDSGIAEALPGSPEAATGRVGFRCTTPDYLPIVGPAPIAKAMQERFALMKKNARADIPLPGTYYSGLYISCGYGSRGLSYAPLAAELLAAQICGEVIPVDRQLAQALNPARFLIRRLKRG